MKLCALILCACLSVILPQIEGFSLTPKQTAPRIHPVRPSSALKKESFLPKLTEDVGKRVLSTVLGSILLLSSHTPIPMLLPGGEASAESRIVGEIAGSGLVFKVKNVHSSFIL